MGPSSTYVRSRLARHKRQQLATPTAHEGAEQLTQPPAPTNCMKKAPSPVKNGWSRISKGQGDGFQLHIYV